MIELEWIKGERKLLQDKYFADTKEVWVNNEGAEAESKAKKILNKYAMKDKYLDQVEVRLESCLEDLENYKLKYKGGK